MAQVGYMPQTRARTPCRSRHTQRVLLIGIHGFDLVATISEHGLDFYGAIKLINYIRTTVKENDGNLTTIDLPQDLQALFAGERYGKEMKRGRTGNGRWQ